MKRSSTLAASLCLVLCVGCRPKITPVQSDTKGVATNNPEISAEIQICQKDCEITPEIKVIHLSPSEQQSLEDALKQKNAAAPATSHLHIEAKDGQLTFGTDQDPAHIAVPGAQIKVQPGIPPVRAVLTPGAQEIVRNRANANTH